MSDRRRFKEKVVPEGLISPLWFDTSHKHAQNVIAYKNKLQHSHANSRANVEAFLPTAVKCLAKGILQTVCS